MNIRKIEEKWQQKWREARLFEAEADERPKFYLTAAYPYVSGPMHVGHGRTYTVPDVIARYKRMRGFNVLFPMAWHFTGTPIIGAAKRVARREPDFVRVLIERYGIAEQDLTKLEDPHYFATYFAKLSDLSYRKGMEELGYSIDWRREFTTVDPCYSKFITWQYHKLMDAGLIVKGKHPVKWCPKCGNPVTDHDLLEGEGAEILEFTLLKYRADGYVLPAATLRPETIFGVTNLWLNPDISYFTAEVDGERWIISREAVEKLRAQGYEVGDVKPLEDQLIGKEVEVPLTKKHVPILPAKFVDPGNATGVVGSVPSHAPYDYVALQELREKPDILHKFDMKPELLKELKPISLIQLPGFGESPAITVVESMHIKDQSDPRLEVATSKVYRGEFAKGVMRDWIPEYGGMRVSDAKNRVRDDLIEKGDAVLMYELSTRPVRCRCGAGCLVKVVEDQWFLDYSNERWKERAMKALEQMKLVPPEIRAQFQHTIEWLHEWPCTRKIGMGTPAPWDPNWTIESLSDSTIYMAYYTIAHLLKGLDPSQLTDEVFDYVFYGRGKKSEIAERTGIKESVLDQMGSQFSYWYPVDYRMSASELIPNHLTFYIFHHAMIFPDQCPRGIVSFGVAALEGQKMSSSKGNIVAINQAVKDHGADTVRLYLMSGVEPWQDFDWKTSEVKAMGRNLEKFYSLVAEIISLPPGEEGVPTVLDRWMLSRLQRHIQTVTDSLEAFETRKAVQHAFFLLMQDVRWYMERGRNAKSKVLKSVVDVWLRLLAPFIPHLCEELWHQMGGKGFVSVAPWPEVKEELIDQTPELVEDYISEVLQDVGEILKVVKVGKPKRVCFYVAPEWKWAAYRMALEEARKGELKLGELIRLVRRKLVTEFGFRPAQAELAEYLQTIVQKVGELSEAQVETLLKGEINEFSTLEEAREFIIKRLNLQGVRVDIFKADDPARYDLQGRARLAAPLRPAIYVE